MNRHRRRQNDFQRRTRSSRLLQHSLLILLTMTTTTTTMFHNLSLPLCQAMDLPRLCWYLSRGLAFTTTARTALSSHQKIPPPFMTKIVDVDVVVVVSVRGGSVSKESPSHHDHGHKSQKIKPKILQRQRPSIWTLYNNLRTGTVLRPCTILVQHLLYWVTAADAVHSLFLNEYSGIYRWLYAPTTLVDKTALVPSVYSKLFYFARLRPRLLYAIGALVRA
jgi:hypothetical protein